MRIHGIRDKTFPFPVPQLKKNYKNGTLTKNRSRDEELAFAQTTSSLLLKSALRFFTFSTAAPQSPVRLYPLFRESRIRSEILLRFCAAVTRISSTNNNQRMSRERGEIRATERLCLLVCIISAGSGCVKATQHPKGKALTRPDLCRS